MRMRVLAYQQQEPDFCNPEDFKSVLEENPDMILLVTKENCPLCPAIRDAATQVADKKQIALLEMEFDKNAGQRCPTLDDFLKVGNNVAMAVVFRNGKKKEGEGARAFSITRLKSLRSFSLRLLLEQQRPSVP